MRFSFVLLMKGAEKVLFFTLGGSDSRFLPCDLMYDRYGDMLFRVCFLILVSHADAEDAVQDVFFKYMDKKPVFSDEEHAKAWLIRVASNHCKDMLRSRKTRSSLSLEEIEDYEIEPEQSEILSHVFALPVKYREVIVLHYLEGYGIKEIAAALTIGESAVKMRLTRGRELLKKELSE